jgi:hypothetical protein
MHRTQRMLVATVLTTALITGAARGADAAPTSKHANGESVARRLVAKLTTSLRQSLPSTRLAPLPTSRVAAEPVTILPASNELPTAPFEASPLQYPTPPPVL